MAISKQENRKLSPNLCRNIACVVFISITLAFGLFANQHYFLKRVQLEVTVWQPPPYSSVSVEIGKSQRRIEPAKNQTPASLPTSPPLSASSTVCEPPSLRPPGSMPLVALNSFPGSGNTWVRFLIEELTGIYTGSVYCDRALAGGGFVGECERATCGCTVVVKVHEISSRRRRQLPWHRAIYLMRNPYNAIVSEWNRKHGGGHTGSARKNSFNVTEWNEHVNELIGTWSRMYDGAIEVFDEILFIHYEDLRSDLEPNLRRIARFLEQSRTTTSSTTINATSITTEARIECTLSHHRGNFKRKKHEFSYEAYSPELRKVIDESIRYVVTRLKEGGHPLPPYANEYLT